MSDLEEAERSRAKKTNLLIAGGIFSLVLPLLGVAYLRITDTSANSLPSTVQGAVFDRRETSSQVLTPSAAAQPSAAPAMAPGAGQKPGGSLGFISGGNEYYQDDKPAPKVGAAMQQAASQSGGEAAGALTVTGKNGAKPAAAPAAKTAVAAPAAKTAQKKPWSPPRLNSGGMGASRFGPQVGSSAGSVGQSGVGGASGGGGAPGGAPGGMPAGGPGMPPGVDMGALMGAAGAGGGAPDMGALMKATGAGGGAGMPQMPAMPPQGGGNQ